MFKLRRRLLRLISKLNTSEAVKEYRFQFLMDEWARRHQT